MTKKKKLSAKEQKEQQKARMAQIRHEHGWTTTETTFDIPPIDESFIQEIAPLMAGDSPKKAIQNMNKAVKASNEWVAEPEFAGIMFPPIEVGAFFHESLQNRGLADTDPAKLSEKRFMKIAHQIMLETITELFTEELREEIIQAMDQLQERFKLEGEEQQAAQVAFVKLALNREGIDELADLPLLQVLYYRSFEAAAQMAHLTKLVDSVTQNGGDLMSQIEETLKNPEIMEEIETMLDQNPVLKQLMIDETEKAWNEGLNAMSNGELDLELFTEEELLHVAQTIKNILVDQATTPETIPQYQNEFVDWVITYGEQLFTPERSNQMVEHLEATLIEDSVPEEYISFVNMLIHRLKEEDVLGALEPYLYRLIMGDFHNWVRAIQAEKNAEDDEEENSV